MEEPMATISLAAHEHDMERMYGIIKRLLVVVIVLIFLLFASNAIWLYEWNQYDYTDVTVDSGDGGNANYLGTGANGVINNG